MTYEERRIREAERGGPKGAQRRSDRRRARRLDESGLLAYDRPLRVVLDDGQEVVGQWTEWYHRRVQRTRRAKASAGAGVEVTVRPAPMPMVDFGAIPPRPLERRA